MSTGGILGVHHVFHDRYRPTDAFPSEAIQRHNQSAGDTEC